MVMIRAALVLTWSLAGACVVRPRYQAPPLPPPAPAASADEAAPIRRIEPGVLRGLMLAGALRLSPDAALAAELTAQGDRQQTATITVCLDEAGAATAVITGPSGLAAFDRAALAVAEGWRFRAYVDADGPRAVCSRATFRHGPPHHSSGAPPADAPDGWYDALPAPMIELPPAMPVAEKLPSTHVGRPATPGVAIARFCRRRGARTAPMVAWLQSSGDAAVDRNLLARRMVAPIDEPSDGALGCALWSAIVPRRPSPEDEPPATTLETGTFEAQRIAGDRHIFPTDHLKDAIQRSRDRGFVVKFRVCVDERGYVAGVNVLSSSGYTGYDMDLVNGIAAWRYRPYLVDGKPARACGRVNFNYRQS